MGQSNRNKGKKEKHESGVNGNRSAHLQISKN